MPPVPFTNMPAKRWRQRFLLKARHGQSPAGKADPYLCRKVKKLYVIEELDPIIENFCRKIGVEVIGKDVSPRCGEYSQSVVRKCVLGTEPEVMKVDAPIPPRPPVMCCGCPHRGVFYTLKKLGVYVSGDIGCYTLGATAPLSAMDTCVCMGASVPPCTDTIRLSARMPKRRLSL